MLQLINNDINPKFCTTYTIQCPIQTNIMFPLSLFEIFFVCFIVITLSLIIGRVFFESSFGLPNYVLSETQPVESVPPAESGDTDSDQPEQQPPVPSRAAVTGVLVSNLRRIYKGAQNCIVGILGFDGLTDPDVAQAEVDKLKDLLVQADGAGCNLQ